jgi:hypothetical protein
VGNTSLTNKIMARSVMLNKHTRLYVLDIICCVEFGREIKSTK